MSRRRTEEQERLHQTLQQAVQEARDRFPSFPEILQRWATWKSDWQYVTNDGEPLGSSGILTSGGTPDLPVRIVKMPDDYCCWSPAAFAEFVGVEDLHKQSDERVSRECWAHGLSTADGLGAVRHTARLLFLYRGNRDAIAAISISAVVRTLRQEWCADDRDRMPGLLLRDVETSMRQILDAMGISWWHHAHGNAWPGSTSLRDLCSISTPEELVRLAAWMHRDIMPRLGLLAAADEKSMRPLRVPNLFGPDDPKDSDVPVAPVVRLHERK